MRRISREDARRLFLSGHGLCADPGRPADAEGVYRCIEQLGFVQVDSINVAGRAHHLILASRLDRYREPQLDELLAERRLFEHWTHDASLIPTRWFPHWHYRFQRYRERIQRHRWWRARLGDKGEEAARRVEERILREGPLRSRDFEDPAGKRSGGWWEWKEPKAALEFLWRSGRLAVHSRVNFQKVYDLVERVLPEHATLPVPDPEEHLDWACSTALERLGVATPTELAGFWNVLEPAQARQWCQRGLSAGGLIPVKVEGRAAVAPADLDGRLSQVEPAASRMRLLCPFDPVLRDRQRAERLFDFQYRFEAFVPAPRRKHGYYVMPLLEGERLVGRLDPKLHRSRGVLEVQGLWWEPGVRPGKLRLRRLREAVERLATFLGADQVDGGGHL